MPPRYPARRQTTGVPVTRGNDDGLTNTGLVVQREESRRSDLCRRSRRYGLPQDVLLLLQCSQRVDLQRVLQYGRWRLFLCDTVDNCCLRSKHDLKTFARLHMTKMDAAMKYE